MCKRIITLFAIIGLMVIVSVSQAVTVIADFDGSAPGEDRSAANLDAGSPGGRWTVINPGRTVSDGGGGAEKIQSYSDDGGNNQFQMDGPREDKNTPAGARSIPFDYKLDFNVSVPLDGSQTLSLDAAVRRAGAGETSARSDLIVGYDKEGNILFELILDGVDATTRGTVGLVGYGPSSQMVNFFNPNTQPATSDMKTLSIVLGESTFDVLVDGVPAYAEITYTDTVSDLSGLQFTGLTSEPDAGYNGLSIDNVIVDPGVLPVSALNPVPEDGATDVLRDEALLSWTPGLYADTHDVYMGTDVDAVSNASRTDQLGVDQYSLGQDANSYDPGRLAFGEVYFWRVDEVNAPGDDTIYKGAVWSFIVEPVASPIAASAIVASHSSSLSDNEGAFNTINESGLDAEDLHSTDNTAMWLSSREPNGASIQYEFDRVYKLHELMVWNYNGSLETAVGIGIREALIEYSPDGSTWETLGTFEFNRAPVPVAEGYGANTTIDFANKTAKAVKITAQSNWGGGILEQYGLSEVRFLAIPTYATMPTPVSGASGVAPDVTLSWISGREVSQSDLYLGVDANNLTRVDGLNASSYDTLAQDLLLGQTYAWRIDEVNEAMDPITWPGPVWTFTTADVIVIDDMEAYLDIESAAIWATWADGFEIDDNGSLVGADPLAQDYSPETDTVRGGNQSLPLHYDNSTVALSEATREFAEPMDWTRHGVQGLELYFQGLPTNTGGRLYVKINDTQIVYDSDADNLKRIGWSKWTIPLADLTGVDLTQVTSLTIGVDNGGQGVVYVDDIVLTPQARELVTPTAPNASSLLGHWEFEGNFNDSSGKGRHGTEAGVPLFDTGALGQAISLDGFGEYVAITGFQGIAADRSDADNPVQQPFTVACWIKTTEDGDLVTWGSSDAIPVGGQYNTFRIHEGSLRAEHGDGNLRGITQVVDGEWHHAAITVAEGANLRTPQTLLYVDGQADMTFSGSDNIYNLTADAEVNIGRRSSHEDRYYPGAIDDVRIYDSVLSAAEIAHLAGRTLPFDKP